MSKPPIFIIGAPRSGTTLLAKILGKHSSIFMPGETHFFSDIYSRRNEFGSIDNSEVKEKIVRLLLSLYGRLNEPSDQARIDNIKKESPDLIEYFVKCGSYRELFSTFMEMQAAHEGKERWGNSAPKDIFHIEEILDFYPDAKIVICVRDMRAFLLSYQGKWKVTAEEQVQRLRNLYHPVVSSLLWKSSMSLVPKIRSRVKVENIIIVPYEELVGTSEAIVRRVCYVVGDEFEPKMLDITTNNSSHEIKNSGIYDTSISKWKAELSAEEIWVSQKIGRKELEYLGYSIEPVSPNFLKILLVVLSSPSALLKALKANRERTGPLISYLMKRIAFLFSKAQAS